MSQRTCTNTFLISSIAQLNNDDVRMSVFDPEFSASCMTANWINFEWMNKQALLTHKSRIFAQNTQVYRLKLKLFACTSPARQDDLSMTAGARSQNVIWQIFTQIDMTIIAASLSSTTCAVSFLLRTQHRPVLPFLTILCIYCLCLRLCLSICHYSTFDPPWPIGRTASEASGREWVHHVRCAVASCRAIVGVSPVVAL